MEIYNVSGHGNGEPCLMLSSCCLGFIQVTESNPQLTSPLLDQVEAMYNEGAPEFFVDQGLYYPIPANYGYYCTGFESPGEWEDHQRIFGVDGPDVQYAGAQTESLPYVYYTPTYGYAQSPYNPYNPYIPGAMIGADSPYVGAQQYYTLSPYQDPVSSHGYIPVIVQSDINPTSPADLSVETGVAKNIKHGPASTSAAFPKKLPKHVADQTNALARISEAPRANVVQGQQPLANGSVSSGFLEARNAYGSVQPMDNTSSGKILSHSNHLKVALPVNKGFSGFESSAHGGTLVDKFRSKVPSGRIPSDLNGSPDGISEQNRGPRTNKMKSQFAVKAYTNKVGNSNAQGHIIVCTEQYNKDDFHIDYADAKFFVIKSYSEDDVHKSIKYNVWSSTPHGNKKLQGAYEDAQKVAAEKSKGCPIFLFFSVNASGQFCGIAEMIGPVDFHKDMDFWQQDKWSGSFPVKWHIIKDVPNTSFRHIILENNENKPVTNSRDTQEIMYRQGLEMLKIFKNYPLKTSLLDDFMYYETRQKIMQEEKGRLILKSFGAPLSAAVLDPNHKITCPELHPNRDEKSMKHSDSNLLKETESCINKQASSSIDAPDLAKNKNSQETVVNNDDIASALKIGSHNINTKPLPNTGSAIASNSVPSDVVTVGSVPVKVNGFAESSRFLTVGTIQLDPRAIQVEKGDEVPKHAS
ncbi:hypothetical protein K2173_022397 [Erythroxylum novogranatense]|uniref:YTH domain-containing family protein n=1 Tax=Erythroxylum novogranatense TaxID=1862640 RepID=A0AAV8TK66_9ROSI|nr:hypothetical protein K2173_022397 [Erythroxylum novogranatense]